MELEQLRRERQELQRQIEEARKAAEAAHERRRVALSQLSSASSNDTSTNSRAPPAQPVFNTSMATSQPDTAISSAGVTDLDVTLSEAKDDSPDTSAKQDDKVTSSPATLAAALVEGSPVGLSSITSESMNIETTDTTIKTDTADVSGVMLLEKSVESGDYADDERIQTPRTPLSPLQIQEAPSRIEAEAMPKSSALLLRRTNSRAANSALTPAQRALAASEAAAAAHAERMRISRERRTSLALQKPLL